MMSMLGFRMFVAGGGHGSDKVWLPLVGGGRSDSFAGMLLGSGKVTFAEVVIFAERGEYRYLGIVEAMMEEVCKL